MLAADVSLDFEAARLLSPKRKSTEAENLEQLADEQLNHFGLKKESDYGQAMRQACLRLYGAMSDVSQLWRITGETLDGLPREDRVAYFNAKKFLCFQLAKILDTLQNPFRKVYQSMQGSERNMLARGPYPVFDNVTALFSANPVIVRTATYIYACTEWVDDAFRGREFLHEIYSRLLNPTSVSLANHIVDVEAGPYAPDYMAWNFNSGMAAIDGLLSSQLRRNDIVIASRHVYGGTWQLLHDYYARPDKMNVQLEWFDGYDGPSFEDFLKEVSQRHEQALSTGSKLLVYLESPCNPFGYVLDMPEICRIAHEHGHMVVQDATVGTPFLNRPLARENKAERPDFVIHSYTKDLTGNGNVTAGVIIGENHRMFQPKGESMLGVSWEETIFWGVYYIKGAFLESEGAFEVLSGMKTLEGRMLQKCINTLVLVRWLNAHPHIRVHSNAVEDNENSLIRERNMRYGLPAPLFAIDFESAGLNKETFVKFFDNLSPGMDHQVSLGQSNTVCLCPALTTHSELDETALLEAGIYPTTIRIAVGLENPKEVLAHFRDALYLATEEVYPGFADMCLSDEATDTLVRDTYLEVHGAHAHAFKPMARR